MDVPTIARVLDTIIARAKQTGMYVIIDDHSAESFGSLTDWKLNARFWSAIAPRYKDDTNVIYELKNEPDVHGRWSTLPDYESSAFKLIRSLAPDTRLSPGRWRVSLPWTINTVS